MFCDWSVCLSFSYTLYNSLANAKHLQTSNVIRIQILQPSTLRNPIKTTNNHVVWQPNKHNHHIHALQTTTMTAPIAFVSIRFHLPRRLNNPQSSSNHFQYVRWVRRYPKNRVCREVGILTYDRYDTTPTMLSSGENLSTEIIWILNEIQHSERKGLEITRFHRRKMQCNIHHYDAVQTEWFLPLEKKAVNSFILCFRRANCTRWNQTGPISWVGTRRHQTSLCINLINLGSNLKMPQPPQRITAFATCEASLEVHSNSRSCHRVAAAVGSKCATIC